MEYLDQLILNCHKAKSAKPIKEFYLKDISELKEIGNCIYVIEQTTGCEKQTFKLFSDFKEKKERACSKLNSPSKVMYVGSSTTGVHNRIKQHLGDGYKGTYALHLSQWFKGEYQIKIMGYDEAKEVIQLIEDNLSAQLKPAFGKQGSNNK